MDLPEPSVVDLRFVEPADWHSIDLVLSKNGTVCVLEDGFMKGGIGEAVSARANETGARSRVFRYGVPDRYIPHSTVEEQWQACGLVAGKILEGIRESL